MNYAQVLALLFLALATFTTVVQSCGDCTPEERAAEIAREQAVAAEAPPPKKKEEKKKMKAPETPSPAPGKEKKDYYKVKDKKDKKEKEDKKKKYKKPGNNVMDITPSPAPAPAPSPFPSGNTTMAIVPSPGNNVMAIVPSPGNNVMAIVPSPGNNVMAIVPPPPNPLAVDVHLTGAGVTIVDQCLNNLGAFQARTQINNDLLSVQCVCCPSSIQALGTPGSCTTLDYPFLSEPFQYCARCQDNTLCEKCWTPTDPTVNDSPCKVADTGTGVGQVVPFGTTVQVEPVGAPGTLVPSPVNVCPPPVAPCILEANGQMYELSEAGLVML